MRSAALCHSICQTLNSSANTLLSKSENTLFAKTLRLQLDYAQQYSSLADYQSLSCDVACSATLLTIKQTLVAVSGWQVQDSRDSVIVIAYSSGIRSLALRETSGRPTLLRQHIVYGCWTSPNYHLCCCTG